MVWGREVSTSPPTCQDFCFNASGGVLKISLGYKNGIGQKTFLWVII
jgi:hypothetical protein